MTTKGWVYFHRLGATELGKENCYQVYRSRNYSKTDLRRRGPSYRILQFPRHPVRSLLDYRNYLMTP